ncbi:MAG: CapA family protein [Candidatus Hydrogenedentes bacterium]|nr:CapA family protein [Candidatus Hydrogenedentota bacterium]
MGEQPALNLFFCGDVMTGRGIDQVLPHPGDPALHERYIHDARDYVGLAKSANGPIVRPVSFEYIWGDALRELDEANPDLRIVNLETSITTSDEFWPRKPVHYRMHPQNVGCLTAARIDCCCLANNHVLDWGYPGLIETLQTLESSSLRYAGAGRNVDNAMQPARLETSAKGRVLVFSVGSETSGIPPEWAAAGDKPGVFLLDSLSEGSAALLAEKIARTRQPGDVAVASIHWGSNWGYEIPAALVRFAHRLVDDGVDLVHGHSSHHVRPLEIYRGKLILYGCGDFITDYEGISGYESYKGGLALMYLARINVCSGELTELRLVPMQSRRFRLTRVFGPDAEWLCTMLNREGRRFNTALRLTDDDAITLRSAQII